MIKVSNMARTPQSRGKCQYCGEETAKSGMTRLSEFTVGGWQGFGIGKGRTAEAVFASAAELHPDPVSSPFDGSAGLN